MFKEGMMSGAEKPQSAIKQTADLQENSAEKRISARIYQTRGGKIGDGMYEMTCCIPSMDVHVPYEFVAHSENEDLASVGEPVACDGSCNNRVYTTVEDITKRRSIDTYDFDKMLDVAKKFHEDRQ